MTCEERRLIVKEWANNYFEDDCKVIHGGGVEFPLYDLIGSIADHINEVCGRGIVVQPYNHIDMSHPIFKDPCVIVNIDLKETWNDGVIPIFIPYNALYDLGVYYRIPYSGSFADYEGDCE